MKYEVKCVDFDAPYVEVPEGSIFLMAEAMARGETLVQYRKMDRLPEELFTCPEIWRITYLEPVKE